MRMASPRSGSSGAPGCGGGAGSIRRTITTLLMASPSAAGTTSGTRWTLVAALSRSCATSSTV